MPEYALDLQARLEEPVKSEQLPETLAFAEGRLLAIQPFTDFNGRLTRLWLWELLRRQRLPPVNLAPQARTAAAVYLQALRSADGKDFRPLAQLWMQRLTGSGNKL